MFKFKPQSKSVIPELFLHAFHFKLLYSVRVPLTANYIWLQVQMSSPNSSDGQKQNKKKQWKKGLKVFTKIWRDFVSKLDRKQKIKRSSRQIGTTFGRIKKYESFKSWMSANL